MADRSVSVWLRADVSGYLASIKKAQLSTSDFSRTASRDAKVHKAEWDKVGKGMLVTGGVIAAGIALAVKASMEFRAQMAQVQSLSGASASQMKQLADAALTVGQRFGFTAKQVAEAETELVKAGLSVKDILGGALTGALTLAADGQMNVADATQIAVSAMTQFKLTGKDVPHVADLLAAGADKALGSVGDLGYALEQSGTIAHQFGWNLQETVGTLAEFANNSLIGEQGGTQLKQMLVQLLTPSAQATALMEKYGFSVQGANGQMVSSTELADRLQKSFGSLTPYVREHAIATIFGSHAQAAANILMTDGAKKNADMVSSVNDAGFAAKQAAGKMDSLAGDLTKLKASFETGLIKTGDQATGTLRGLVQILTRVTTWFDNLSDSQRALVTQGALAVGAITLIGGAALIALPKIVAFRDALATLGLTGATQVPGLDAAAAAEGAASGAGAGGGILAGARGKIGGIGGLGLVAAGATMSLNSDTLPSKPQQAYKNYAAEHPGATPKSFANFVASTSTNKAAASQLRAYGEAGYKAKAGADAAGDASKKAAGGIDKVTNSSHHATQTVQEYADALKAVNQPALDARSAARNYQAALDDATASLKANGHTLDTNTDKGRANQQALDAIAAAANASAAANRANGASLPQVTKQLDVARASLYQTARRFGMGKDAAHAYVNEVLGIPGHANTQVTLAGIKAARKAAHDLKVWLQNELGVINIQAKVRNQPGHTAGLTRSDPGAVPQGHSGITPWTGGYITGPGTGTSDSIPAWLSNGEFVINAASARRLGIDNLHALNRYASGGHVGRSTGGSSASPWSMPERVILEVDGQQFTAYVRGHAASVSRQAMNAEARAIAGRPR